MNISVVMLIITFFLIPFLLWWVFFCFILFSTVEESVYTAKEPEITLVYVPYLKII